MDDLMQVPVVYLDEGLGAFYWPQQYKKDVGFTALYTADQMRDYAKQAVEFEIDSIINLLMIQHEAAAGRHNYWQVAANLIQAERR